MSTIKDSPVTNEIVADGDIPPPRGSWNKFRSNLARGSRALQHRNYRLFWTSQVISLVGTWMQNLAQSWLVLTLSNNSPLALGVVFALQFLPSTFLSLFGGIIADRYSKLNALKITQSSAMLLATVLGILTATGVVQIWQVYICAFLLGIVNAFDMPIRQSFVSEMVGKEDLQNAVALNSTMFNSGRLFGPALAGLLIGLGERLFNSTIAGVSLAIWINALSYIGVIISLFKMNPAELYTAKSRAVGVSILNSLKESFGYIKATPLIFSLIIAVGAIGTFGINFNVWIPVLSREILKVGAEGYGVLMAGLGAGALISALSLTVSRNEPYVKKILFSIAAFGLFEVVVALSGWYLLSLAGMVGMGLSMIQAGASSNTLVQMTTPDHLRGRVMSVYMLVFAGTAPFGGLFFGWLGSSFGTPFSMVVGGSICTLATPFVALYYFSHQKKVLPATTPTA